MEGEEAMNFGAFERAQVASFAYREGRVTGSVDCIRAICFVLRNRVRSGWGDGSGSWLSILAGAAEVAGSVEPFSEIDNVNDRILQLIVRDIDDIYLGQDRMEDNIRQIVETDDRRKPVLYYSFVDRSMRAWFRENIVRNPMEHQHVGNVGPMLLFR
jgi:hypothetical protein